MSLISVGRTSRQHREPANHAPGNVHTSIMYVIASFGSLITTIMDPAEPTLPFDVISEVIDQMDSDTDGLTLRTLSTTCRALLKPSQRKLFNSLKILVTEPYNDAQQPRYFALNDLFNTSPPLAAYIRRLNVAFAVPFPATVPILVSILERLGSTTSLRIDNGVWPAEHTKQVPPWRNCLNAVLRYPSLRRLDLENCSLLPSTVWQLPVLTSIDLAGWRIEEPGINYARHSLRRRLAMTWDMSPDPRSTLRSFLKISPRLIHLRVTQNSRMYFLILYKISNGGLTTII